MQKKKMAIVSSYNESCGNASYTEVLRREFSKYYDVDILALPQGILRSNYALVAKKADAYIDSMAKKIREYDYVNFQFEAGLFGNSKKLILKRFKKLLDNSKNTIVTMHRVDLPRGTVTKSAVKSMMKFRFMDAYHNIHDNSFVNLYQDVVKAIAAKGNKASIMVHTERERNNLRDVFGYESVNAFPITFLNEEQRKRVRTAEDHQRFLKEYGFKDGDIVIGLFGFVSAYKCAETAIKALSFLPANYKIAIFGKQHPMSIMENMPIDGYIKSLMDLIEENSMSATDFLKMQAELAKAKNQPTDNSSTEYIEINRELSFDRRVFFEGELDDDQFIDALYGCDFAVLPYMETNQSGSGVASLVVETKIKSLFSSSKAFSELQRYYPNCYETFDIGNYIELANKLENYHHDYNDNLDKAMETYNIENNVKNHVRIFEQQD